MFNINMFIRYRNIQLNVTIYKNTEYINTFPVNFK